MGTSSPDFEPRKDGVIPQKAALDVTNKISRRSFITWTAEKAAQLALLGTTAGVLQGSDKIISETSVVVPLKTKVKTEKGWNVNFHEYTFTRANTYLKKPARFQGKAFDITSRQYTYFPGQNSILLSNTDVFVNRGYLSSRNMLATPELLLKHPVFLEILSRSEQLRRAINERLGGQYGEFHLPQAVTTAITEILTSDTNSARKRPFSNLSSRLSDRATDCQEFTAITAYALACNGIASDVIGYSFIPPGGDKLSHICNVININGTCCVIDTTYSNEILTLADYLRKHPGIPIGNNQVFYDSVFPDQRMPWDNPSWIGKENEVIAQGSNYVTSVINDIQTIQATKPQIKKAI